MNSKLNSRKTYNPGGLPDGVSFRDAALDDLKKLAALDEKLFPPAIAFEPDIFFYYFHHPRSVFIVAEKDSEISGFAASYSDARRAAQILTVDVAPDFQRKGLGYALMTALEERLKNDFGIRRVNLEVAVDNTPAKILYEKLGYEAVGVIRRYYPDGTDAMRMTKQI